MTVHIKPLTVENTRTSWRWRNDPDVWRFTRGKPTIFVSEDIEREWFLSGVKRTDTKRFGIYVDDIYVGNTQLTNVTSTEAEFHIFIGSKAYWGRGVGYLASILVLRYAFDQLKLHRIYLSVHEANFSAVRLYQRLGFEIEGLVEGYYKMVLNGVDIPKPEVSVFSLVFNHEPFLQDYFKGILSQKVNFDFELVIGEDCSTDGSRAVLKHFRDLYPGRIKLLLHEKNLGAALNQKVVLGQCSGKYVAMCEGDDYWIDEGKLQKQYDFMEDNVRFSACFGKSKVLNLKRNSFMNEYQTPKKDVITISDIMNNHFIPTATFFFRRSLVESDTKFSDTVISGDIFLEIMLIMNGPFKFFDEYFSVYRKHEAGITSNKKVIEQGELSLTKIYVYFFKRAKGENRMILRNAIAERYLKLIHGFRLQSYFFGLLNLIKSLLPAIVYFRDAKMFKALGISVIRQLLPFAFLKQVILRFSSHTKSASKF